MTEWFNTTATIYNVIAKTATEDKHYDRHTLTRCNIQKGETATLNGTVVNIVNAITVITKDTARYREPSSYSEIPKDLRQGYYTARIGDFIVFSDVDDEVTTSLEFQNLQDKYRDNGMVIRQISPSIYGMAVDNVQFMSVG